VIKSLRDVSGDVPRIGSASQISQEN
jgi:hypothetical protein